MSNGWVGRARIGVVLCALAASGVISPVAAQDLVSSDESLDAAKLRDFGDPILGLPDGASVSEADATFEPDVSLPAAEDPPPPPEKALPEDLEPTRVVPEGLPDGDALVFSDALDKEPVAEQPVLEAPEVVEESTTEQQVVVQNPDGSRTAKLSAGDVRTRDELTGGWVDLDTTLEQTADGGFAPKVGVTPVSIAATATGGVSVGTQVGSFEASHLGASDVPGAAFGAAVVYRDALPNERDVLVQARDCQEVCVSGVI